MHTINDLITKVLNVRPHGIILLTANDKEDLLSAVDVLLPEQTTLAQQAISQPNEVIKTTGTFGEVIFFGHEPVSVDDAATALAKADAIRLTEQSLLMSKTATLVLTTTGIAGQYIFNAPTWPTDNDQPRKLAFLASLHVHTTINMGTHTTIVKRITNALPAHELPHFDGEHHDNV